MGSINMGYILLLIVYLYLSYLFGRGLSSIIVYTLHSYVRNIPEKVDCKFITTSIVSGLYLIPILMEMWIIVSK